MSSHVCHVLETYNFFLYALHALNTHSMTLHAQHVLKEYSLSLHVCHGLEECNISLRPQYVLEESNMSLYVYRGIDKCKISLRSPYVLEEHNIYMHACISYFPLLYTDAMVSIYHPRTRLVYNFILCWIHIPHFFNFKPGRVPLYHWSLHLNGTIIPSYSNNYVSSRFRV